MSSIGRGRFNELIWKINDVGEVFDADGSAGAGHEYEASLDGPFQDDPT